MSESDYQARIMIEASKLPGVRLERRNVGTVRTDRGSYFHAGPKKGACDLGGVAAPGGWAIYIECKVAGRKRSPQQIAYAEMVQAHGAIYLLADEKAHSVEQVIDLLRAEIALRRGENEIEVPFLREGKGPKIELLPGEELSPDVFKIGGGCPDHRKRARGGCMACRFERAPR